MIMPKGATVPVVALPAVLELLATCPNCSERAPMAVSLSTVLEVEDDDSSLKVKAKSKKVDHICGQIPLPIVAEGQTSVEDAAAAAVEALDGTTIEHEDGTVATISAGRGVTWNDDGSLAEGETTEETAEPVELTPKASARPRGRRR